MEEKGSDNILYVQMFGEFSVTWNGKRIAGRNGAGETQFVSLLQLLLHDQGRGIDRNLLEEVLFAGRDLQDRGHAMRSILYNARKKLRKACLPDLEYISQKSGVYYWTDEVRVEEDAARMDRLYQQVGTEEDPERLLELCLSVCYCYTGEFLGTQAKALWAEKEARRYREQFCYCMEQAAELLRERKDYTRMEALGLHGARVHPLAEWETVTMEALAASGKAQEARKFYDDTVSYYFQEQGMRPSGRLTELLHSLGGQMEHTYAAFDEIQDLLSEDGEKTAGGYVCTWPVFEGIYQMLVRMLERSGQSVYLMLCTLVDGKGNPVEDNSVLEQLTERLCESICCSVRRSDVVNRYGKGQYLVLLFNTTRESCRILQKRINTQFRSKRQRMGIRYHVKSVICTQEMEQKIMNWK
ncbi:MAG: hypothetical protein K2N46_03210 [Lachnospiraceae bacterium]|nr:hypothetical protein [Lachnospiraceae bacterium]